jgi:hypothetical protein
MSLVEALRGDASVIAAELRPPRAELSSFEGMDAWIDMYHAVRSLTRQDVRVFLTDSAVGTQEENNLRHLVTNLGADVARERIVPFLTSKHSIEYCLTYAEQTWQHGFPALVVLGGDRAIGRARCVEHAWQLRRAIRDREPRLALGGWANPYGDPSAQVDYLLQDEFTAEFYLTQVVSHLDAAPVERFLGEAARRGLTTPGLFGVFFYRSANARTLETLRSFLPVPVDALVREFGAGASPVDVCARTLRAMMDAGARHFYISNLPLARATSTLHAILERVGVTA